MTDEQLLDAEIRARAFISGFRELCKTFDVDGAVIIACDGMEFYQGIFKAEYTSAIEQTDMIEAINNAIIDALQEYKIASGKIS